MAVRRACRSVSVVVLLVASLLLTIPFSAPGYACACGAAIAPPGTNATMNHEVALVHWDGTIETIVMQLAMNASTGNVALVIPTPTPATVATADQATFTELGKLTAPRTQHHRHWTLGMFWNSPAGRDAAAGARAPRVVSQVHLGPLEATTLAGGDLAGLQKWLSDNGYEIKPAVSEALNPYLRDGWAFVAMRLTSTTPITGGLDPVRLTFPSPNLVYPMRLSVAAESPQHVTIFALSDHRQQRTDTDRSTQTTQVQFAGNIAGAANDPLLRELAGNHGAYLTKTQIDITRTSGITSDFTFGNAPDDDPYQQVIDVDDDVTVPSELVVPVLLAAVIVAAVVIRRRRRQTSAALGQARDIGVGQQSIEEHPLPPQ